MGIRASNCGRLALPMSEFFHELTPDKVLHAVERGGFEPTGHCSPLTCLENRVYDLRLEGGAHIVVKFYRPERWSREAILEEHALPRRSARGGDPRLRAASVRGWRHPARDRRHLLRRLASHRRALAGRAGRGGSPDPRAAAGAHPQHGRGRGGAASRAAGRRDQRARAAALSREQRLAASRMPAALPRGGRAGGRALRRLERRACPCTASTATATAATCSTATRAGSSSTSTTS